MTGKDWVQVDSPRANAAAAALEGLRGTLDGQMQAILSAISKLRAAGADIPAPTALVELASQAPGDAAKMRAAADLAARMQHLNPGAVNTITGMVNLSVAWDGAALAQAAGRADAAALAAAEQNLSIPANRAVLSEVVKDIADHQGDAAYLKTFWAAPSTATAVATLAGALTAANGHNLSALTKPDQAILATFGTSLASAMAHPGLLDPVAAIAIEQAFSSPLKLWSVNSPDQLWSAAMVIKYGPSGAAYGTGSGADLLAAMSRSVLSAINQHDLTQYNPEAGAAVLEAAVSNVAATRQVLGGPAGSAYASVLLQTPFNAGVTVSPAQAARFGVPGQGAPATTVNAQLSQIFPAFLYEATAATSSRLSAQALLNIMDANAYIPASTSYPPQIVQALTAIARTRMLDFAETAGTTDSASIPGSSAVHGTWVATSNLTQLNAYLSRILDNPVDSAGFLGWTKGALVAGTRLQAITGHNWVHNFGALSGLTQHMINVKAFGQAQHAAQVKAFWEEMSSLALAPILSIPTKSPSSSGFIDLMVELFSRGALKYWKVRGPRMLAAMGAQIATNNLLAGGDPASQIVANDNAFISDLTTARIWVIQGLVASGKLKPQPSWYKNGHVQDNNGLSNLITNDTKSYAGHTLEQWVQLARNGMATFG